MNDVVLAGRSGDRRRRPTGAGGWMASRPSSSATSEGAYGLCMGPVDHRCMAHIQLRCEAWVTGAGMCVATSSTPTYRRHWRSTVTCARTRRSCVPRRLCNRSCEAWLAARPSGSCALVCRIRLRSPASTLAGTHTHVGPCGACVAPGASAQLLSIAAATTSTRWRASKPSTRASRPPSWRWRGCAVVARSGCGGCGSGGVANIT